MNSSMDIAAPLNPILLRWLGDVGVGTTASTRTEIFNSFMEDLFFAFQMSSRRWAILYCKYVLTSASHMNFSIGEPLE